MPQAYTSNRLKTTINEMKLVFSLCLNKGSTCDFFLVIKEIGM
jgi:hypothetical protein